ncbi:helix-turn-helix transcriptional regulator [Streptomyces sp. NPDC127051]|uniref:helix-turn-helix transcriptional regulator n=1 Tax=Streptomyces sp. NPDC127051 TaxID=3347119 RepID=UPI00365BE026
MAAGPTETIARKVADLRERKGLTKQELGDALTELGVSWNRFTVSSLENGKRQNLSVTEWLALARALDVAPLTLLLPLGEADEIEVLPGLPVHPDLVRQWIVGEEQAVNEQGYTVGDSVFWSRHTEPLRLYSRLPVAQEAVRGAKSALRIAESVGREEAVTRAREANVGALRQLADILKDMSGASIRPPALPASWLDEMVELGMLDAVHGLPQVKEG